MTDIHENRLYLACAHHPDEGNIMLGKRRAHGFTRAPSAHELNAFFTAHENCPGAPDCFKLAYGASPNWDQAVPAPEIAKHVRLELVKTA